MKTCIVIPARYASTRYPGKPLVTLTGKTGVSKTLVQRSWERASSVAGIDRVVVATDDERIAKHVRDFGGDVVMTAETCENGTERCADALKEIEDQYELIVNFQGDAPMTPSWFVEDLINAMKARDDVDVATPILACDEETFSHFIKDRSEGRVGGTTAVFGTDMKALYFSKEVLPYGDPEKVDGMHRFVFHHVGVYAYRKTALLSYPVLKKGPLEKLEGLEQLRFLENGHNVLCVKVDALGEVFWELNNPVDVQRIEEHIV